MPYSSGTFSRVHDFTDDRDNGIRIQASRMDAEMDGIATGLSTALLKDGTQTATAKIPFAVGLSVIDNQTILLGTNSDIAIQYDETTNDSLEISANIEGAALGIVLKSDQGDDNADQHKLSIADGGTLTLGSKISGSFVTYLTHTPNATVTSSTLAVAGNLTVGGNLTLGSGAELSEAELEMLDGITAGTVAASKAVVVDANKDIASFRNITLTGELDAGSLDVSGDADIDGTLEADAMTLNGTAITTVATLSTGISNGNLPVFTSGVADDDFLRVNGTSIEGRSASEVLSDIGASAVAGSSSIVTTGALNAGSITSGFGTIDTGSSTITTTGVGTFGSLDISGDIDVDGTTNLDIVDIDGAVDMASTLQVDGAITSSTGMTITTADNTTQMTLTSTDADASVGPVLDLYRNSSSPADGDRLGSMTFRGRNDNSQDVTYATFRAFASDVSDGSEDTEFEFTTILAGSEVARMTTVATETVFNQASADIDFRVESDNNTHALFVQGSDGNVGIGVSPSHKLEVHSANATNIVAKSTNGNGGYLNYSGLSSGGTTTFSVTHNGRVFAEDGIQFDSSGEVLDSYEEGTYIVGIFDALSGGNQSPTTTTGYYTKIGEMVFFSFNITGINITGLTSGNDASFTLPFTSSSTQNKNFCASAHVLAQDVNWAGSQTQISSFVGTNATRFLFYVSGDNSTIATVKVSEISSADFYVSGQMRV